MKIVKNWKRNPCQLVGFIRVHGGEAKDVKAKEEREGSRVDIRS